jgi:hypothetical protein
MHAHVANGSESLPPSQVRSRVGTSLNIKISKHFLAASTTSPKGMPFSQPDSDSQVVLLNKFDQQ